ncbi:hypothetical protein [Clostridium sp. DJ247]|uniref:hypothetical protein n=1 Tax=Clostridium sp. DJ247 TaxID=2726188 RepID=UPI0016263FD1|nr:hypothetical protein [Clostridium sp. DJ247]MBC2580017.1 hypothetical protein [Clostridium sp. DJ247]
MTKKYSVVLMEDENNCAVKQVSQNTYDQMTRMRSRGESDSKILKSLVELDTTEDNIVINGVTKSEAIDYALDEGQDYLVLQAFHR